MGRLKVGLAAAVVVLLLGGLTAGLALRDDPSQPPRSASPAQRDDAPPQDTAPDGDTATSGTDARSTPAPEPATDDRLNLVLVLTDDQTLESMRVMPQTRSLLGGHGITFTHTFASTPLCCPDRASILTGTYSHEHGVYDNFPPRGGLEPFDDSSTLATWLQDAGYRTSMIGKYLNGYEQLTEPLVPPGWDDWHGFAPKSERAFFDYDLYSNGEIVRYGDDPEDYLTDVMADHAERFIATSDEPFFMLFAPYAPHHPALPAPRDADAFADEPPWRPPSYNIATPGTHAGRLDPLTSELTAFADDFYPKSLASLLAVDQAVADIAAALERRGELDETVFVYTSDNGLLLGEHRVIGKTWAYEESIRVPLIVRLPWVDDARTDDRFVEHVDLAPTFAELAGIEPQIPPDGLSLVPLLRGDDVDWRDAAYLEFLGDRNVPLVSPPYRGVRTDRYKLIAYLDGERELYDLEVDPNELVNLADLPGSAAILRELTERLDAFPGTDEIGEP